MNDLLNSSAALLIWGALIHLVCDWLFQSSWMSDNKANLRHGAGYAHAGVHTLGLCLIFPWMVAVVIGITHLLIDTRVPLRLWSELCVQTPRDPENPITLHIALWRDQTLHLFVIGLAALATVYWQLSR